MAFSLLSFCLPSPSPSLLSPLLSVLGSGIRLSILWAGLELKLSQEGVWGPRQPEWFWWLWALTAEVWKALFFPFLPELCGEERTPRGSPSPGAGRGEAEDSQGGGSCRERAER